MTTGKQTAEVLQARTKPKGDTPLDKLVRQRMDERKRLLARGSEVKLLDPATGEQRSAKLVFTARNLATIEDDYGSIQNFAQAPAEGKIMHHIAYAFSLCFGLSDDEVWDLIDSPQMGEYEEAIGNALMEAMPAPTEEQIRQASAQELGVEEENPTPAPQSPGGASSIRSSSASVSPRSSSGT